MKIKKRYLVSFLLPCLILFSIVYLAPLGMVVGTSFFDWRAGKTMTFAGLKNYVDLFTSDTRMHAALTNTGIWVLLQSTVHVCIGTTLAFMLSRKFRGWKILRTIYMIPNVISSAALGVIFLNVFNPKYGLVNSLVSLITGGKFTKNWFIETDSVFWVTTGTWLLYTGLIVIIVLAGILSIPDDIIEAARIDGASPMQIHFRIQLPLIRTVLGTSTILAATSMLKEFDLIYLTTNGGPGDMTINLPLYLYKTSMIDNNYGYANTMGVFLIVCGIMIVYAINRIFRMNTADY